MLGIFRDGKKPFAKKSFNYYRQLCMCIKSVMHKFSRFFLIFKVVHFFQKLGVCNKIGVYYVYKSEIKMGSLCVCLT